MKFVELIGAHADRVSTRHHQDAKTTTNAYPTLAIQQLCALTRQAATIASAGRVTSEMDTLGADLKVSARTETGIVQRQLLADWMIKEFLNALIHATASHADQMLSAVLPTICLSASVPRSDCLLGTHTKLPEDVFKWTVCRTMTATLIASASTSCAKVRVCKSTADRTELAL